MLTRDDLNHLADLVNLDRDLRNAPDDQLLMLIMHEMFHAYEREMHTAIFRAMRRDVFVRYFTDPRVLRGWLEYISPPTPEPPAPMTLAERLERGAQADIWYDAAAHSDDDVADMIGDAQDAMMAAARILREHGLDRVL